MATPASSASPRAPAAAATLPDGRWRPLEIAFWLLPVACFFLLPNYRVLGSQILITGLFARLARPDPRLRRHRLARPCGVLRHRRVYGGPARRAWLARADQRACSRRRSSPAHRRLRRQLPRRARRRSHAADGDARHRPDAVRGGEQGGIRSPAASTGCRGVTMGTILGVFRFDIGGTHRVRLQRWWCCSSCSCCVAAARAFAVRTELRGIREGGKRMPAIGAPVRAAAASRSSRSRAAVAGIAGALLAQTTQFVGIDTLGFPRSAELLIMLVLGGTGRLYGGLVGAAVFMIAQDYLSGIDPVYWQFWIGLLPRRRRAVRARRHPRRARRAARARMRRDAATHERRSRCAPRAVAGAWAHSTRTATSRSRSRPARGTR